MAKKVFENN